MTELSPQARALVEAGRAEVAPAAAKASVKAAVLAEVGAASGGAAAAATAAKSGLVMKAGLGVVVSLGLVAGAVALREPAPERAEVELAVVEAPPAADAPAAAEAKPNPAEFEVRQVAPIQAMRQPVQPVEPAKSQRPKRVRAVRKPAPAPAAPAPSLADEVRLLKKIQRALRAGQYSAVLELTEAHAQRFPEGALVKERLAARARALCGAGDKAAGLSVRGQLAETSPGPAVLARVDDACR